MYISQTGALEIHVRKVTAKKFHPARLSFGQVRSGENGFRHVRIPEISSPKVCTAGKVCAGESRFSEVGSFEVDVSKDSAAKVYAGQISVGKVRAGQVCSCSAFFTAEKAFVRFQDFRKRFSVVFDAFRFSESHWSARHRKCLENSLLDVAVTRNSAGLTRGRNRGSSLRPRGLRRQRIDHPLGHVFAPP